MGNRYFLSNDKSKRMMCCCMQMYGQKSIACGGATDFC